LRVAAIGVFDGLTPQSIGMALGSAARRSRGRDGNEKKETKREHGTIGSRVDFILASSHNSRAFEHG
jgi:hypothetical protein